MKRSILALSTLTLLALIALVAASGPVHAAELQTHASYKYLTDSDGDGVPNCEDPDYVPPQDGTGFKYGKTRATSTSNTFARYTWNWRIMVVPGLWLPSLGVVSASGYGPGDGTGNDGIGPADGTGYGPGPHGTGDCEGLVLPLHR
jgi:hypothetical protein